MFSPECPWEIIPTFRFNSKFAEGAVRARRDLEPGENIDHLEGRLISLETTESALGCVDLTFSTIRITGSPRSLGHAPLFVGPAHFLNHDCREFNARLVHVGQGAIHVHATRAIQSGQEITIFYGSSYFGEKNQDCLCGACRPDGVGLYKTKRVAQARLYAELVARHLRLYNRPWPYTTEPGCVHGRPVRKTRKNISYRIHSPPKRRRRLRPTDKKCSPAVSRARRH